MIRPAFLRAEAHHSALLTTCGNAPIAPHTLVNSDEALGAAIEWLAEQT